jgi:hypothetical protein
MLRLIVRARALVPALRRVDRRVRLQYRREQDRSALLSLLLSVAVADSGE